MSNYADASPIRSVGCTSEDCTAKEGSGPLAYRRRANDCAGINSRLLEIAAGGGRRGPSVHNSTSQQPGVWSAGSTNETACGCAFRTRSTVSSSRCAWRTCCCSTASPARRRPTPALGRFPVLGEHFQTIRAKPRQIFADRPREALAVPEMPATQDRMVLDDGDDGPGKIEQGLVLRRQLPLQPAPLVILIVGISVPLLGAPDLVTCTQHGHALREQQRREVIALLLGIEGCKCRGVSAFCCLAAGAPVSPGHPPQRPLEGRRDGRQRGPRLGECSRAPNHRASTHHAP